MAGVPRGVVFLALGHGPHEALFQLFMRNLSVVLRVRRDVLLGDVVHHGIPVGNLGHLAVPAAGNVLRARYVSCVAGDVVLLLLLSHLFLPIDLDLATVRKRCE